MIDQLIESLIQYDVVALPSNGIYYADKRSSLKVSYLNASDENLLANPVLINNNQIIDALLRRKIMDKDFAIEDMSEDDKRAVLLFLRNTSFGPEYHVSVWDEDTQSSFSHTIDLNEIQFKELTIVPDADGEFEFTLPKTKAKVKFKFLLPKQEEELRKFEKEYKGPLPEAPIITKQMEMLLKEVSGERDPMKLYQFIQIMPITDAQELRKFVRDNKPGLNMNVPVKTPSGREVIVEVTFGVEFFRPFFGI